MIEENTYFISDGIKLNASFWQPEPGEEKSDKPYVIVCSGFTGMMRIHPERYARTWTKRGFPCFGFDYRGFGESGGDEGQVLLDDQVRDIANAVAFVSIRAAKENRKIVLAGWGMGGGLVVSAAKLVPQVDGLVAMNGFYNNLRVQKQLRGEEGFQKFMEWLGEERRNLVTGGQPKAFDPFDIYPLDPISREYVDTVLRKVPGYGLSAHIAFADSLLSFDVEGDLSYLGDTPIMIAHGAENLLHPPGEARSLHEKYPGPKEIFLLEGAGHTEWMLDENPLFQTFSARIADWMDKTFS